MIAIFMHSLRVGERNGGHFVFLETFIHLLLRVRQVRLTGEEHEID